MPALSKNLSENPQRHKERKALALMALAENFAKELSPALLGLWLGMLQAYSPAQVERGVAQVIATFRYKTLPPLAVLLEAIEEQSGCGEKALERKALAEWAWLMRELDKGLCYRSPERVHPTTAQVVRLMGGFAQVALWPEASLDFKRRDFLALWKESHARPETAAPLLEAATGGGGIRAQDGFLPLASAFLSSKNHTFSQSEKPPATGGLLTQQKSNFNTAPGARKPEAA